MRQSALSVLHDGERWTTMPEGADASEAATQRAKLIARIPG